MFKHKDLYLARVQNLLSGSLSNKRQKRLLRYIKEHPWTHSLSKEAKQACGFRMKARTEWQSMSLHMARLWYDGHLEGISFNGRVWEYIAVENAGSTCTQMHIEDFSCTGLAKADEEE